MKTTEKNYTHPMDGEWVEQAATLFIRRYYGDSSPSITDLDRIRFANCVRECLPAPERIDARVPACLRALRKYAIAFEGLAKIMQGTDDPQQVASACAQTCIDTD